MLYLVGSVQYEYSLTVAFQLVEVIVRFNQERRLDSRDVDHSWQDSADRSSSGLFCHVLLLPIVVTSTLRAAGPSREFLNGLESKKHVMEFGSCGVNQKVSLKSQLIEF